MSVFNEIASADHVSIYISYNLPHLLIIRRLLLIFVIWFFILEGETESLYRPIQIRQNNENNKRTIHISS